MKSKKMIFALAAVMLLGTVNAQAQGLLGKLKNKAEKAIESKVGGAIESKVSETVDDLLSKDSKDKKATSKGTARNDGTYESAPENFYVTNLIDADEEWTPQIGIDDKEGQNSTLSFATYSAALEAMPALPNASDICTDEGKEIYAKKVQDYAIAVAAMQTEYIMATARFSEVSAGTVEEVDAALNSNEMTAAMEVAEEWFKLPEAEQKKIEEMAKKDEEAANEYCKKKHPALYKKMMALPKEQKTSKATDGMIDEEKSSKYEDIDKKLSDIQLRNIEATTAYAAESMKAMAKAALTGKQLTMGSSPMETELITVHKQIAQAWATSDEAAKVLKMEQELNDKTVTWMKSAKKGWNDELPDFWHDGRRAQNEIIDKYNAAQAEKWLQCISKSMEAQQADVTEIVRLDSELEELRGNAEGDMFYWKAKMTSGMLNSTVANYLLLHRVANSMPLVRHVPEIYLP